VRLATVERDFTQVTQEEKKSAAQKKKEDAKRATEERLQRMLKQTGF
jgi:hypothetical protein